MFLLLFALLIHGVYSIPPCKDGMEIELKKTKNSADIIGNWTYVYHWDPKLQAMEEFIDRKNIPLNIQCPVLYISEISPEDTKAKEAECTKYKIPFNWDDVKLRVDAPSMKINSGIITIGEKENWMMVDCVTMVRVVFNKISDDYMIMTNPDKGNTSELIVKEIPTLEELKCIAHNVDVGKDLHGLGVCYKS